jgi:Cd2+/Zn2+-exporting ATPase
VRASAGRGLAGEIDGVQYFLGSPRSVGTLSPDVVRRIEELEAQGNTVAVLKGKTVVGLIAVRDEPRNDARRGLRALSRLGVNVIMLTGDNRRTADAVAAGLGIEARAELLPEDKARIVAELQASDRGPVGKVGDGINDAPALAAAAVGIAMGSGSDVAIETADAALLKNDVMGVAELIALSRATLANVRVNVAVALGSKAIFLVTTVLGLTGMWIAVLADTGATVLVTLNALRLLQFRFKSQ